jgi:hypothetical protein
MANSVTGSEVRNRLRTLTSVEVDDTVLDSPAYIPACESFVNVILSNNSFTIATLSADKKKLALAAIISFVCMRVIASAPLHSFKVAGLNEHKETDAADKKIMLDMLREEAWELLSMIGISKYRIYFTSKTSSDYMPDGTDETNLLMTDTVDTTFSMWP